MQGVPKINGCTNLAGRKLCQELFAGVGLAEDELVGDLDLSSAELSSDESFVGPEIVGVCVQSLKHNRVKTKINHNFQCTLTTLIWNIWTKVTNRRISCLNLTK